MRLDQGITDLALNWADQVSRDAGLPRIAVVLPAVTDFTVMSGSIIKLGVPGNGVLEGLPGRHARVRALRRRAPDAADGGRHDHAERPPAKEKLYQAAESAQAALPYTLGHELFADAFAAAVAGPAYTRYHLRYGPPLGQPAGNGHAPVRPAARPHATRRAQPARAQGWRGVPGERDRHPARRQDGRACNGPGGSCGAARGSRSRLAQGSTNWKKTASGW